MENADIITLEAKGEFPFEFFIEKAVAEDDGDELIIEGIASTTNVDHDNERMSEDALRSMEAAINNGGVPLRVEHQKDDNAIIGSVFKAWVDNRNQLHVQARLDKSHPVSSVLHSAMKGGAKMGLSVGGVVKRAVREFVESVGNVVKTFYDVALNEVSVTPRPANYDSWLIAKSIAADEKDAARFKDSSMYKQFLFENPRLDYLQTFAKSIPDQAWRKVANNNNSIMSKSEETTTEDTTKAVSRGEFNAMKTTMNRGFKAILSSLAKMTGESSTEDETTKTGSETTDEETRSKNESSSTEDETTKTSSETTDEETRSKTESSSTEDETTKTGSESTETDTTKTESSSTEDETTKTSSSSETEDEKADTSEYNLTSVERTIKAIEGFNKRLESESSTEDETTKTTGDTEADGSDLTGEREAKAESSESDTTKTSSSSTEDETAKTGSSSETTEEKAEESETSETTKGMHPVDRLVATIGKAMDLMEARYAKSNMSVPGFRKSVIDTLRNDSEFQEELASMIKLPGFKKSVMLGTAYVPGKDGRKYQLTATGASQPTIEKSEGNKSFKEVFKKEFSSVAHSSE